MFHAYIWPQLHVSCVVSALPNTKLLRLPYRCNSKLLGIYIYLDMKLLVSFPHSCKGMNIDVGWHNLHIYSY